MTVRQNEVFVTETWFSKPIERFIERCGFRDAVRPVAVSTTKLPNKAWAVTAKWSDTVTSDTVISFDDAGDSVMVMKTVNWLKDSIIKRNYRPISAHELHR